jgi:hypothetical protein
MPTITGAASSSQSICGQTKLMALADQWPEGVARQADSSSAADSE